MLDFRNIVKKKIYKECNQKILFVLAFLPSQCVYRKWRKKYVN